ncbi:alpha/beta fold hydrolase [Rhodanobacter aciditrophus]|uniref:alpha/beta fold hydrolase n=1 Tax=Rhodanobacter aciditrophus TaxID=1623218 RepID=UPI003CF51F23
MESRHAGFLGMACVGLLATASAMASPAAPAQTPDSYARPGRLVAIGPGRSLDLRCSGSGPTTVLLESGAHADSESWFRVQPMLAAHARVCSYDRAGYGFSGEGPLPRGVDADVSDLHALIRAAGLHMPLVLVGHSLGSNIVRRYASEHPGEVAGMVLVDPPAQDLGRFMPAQWMKDDATLDKQRDAFIAGCEHGAERGELARPPQALAQCIDKPAPWQSKAVAAVDHARMLRPAFWHTVRSELAQNVPVFASPVPAGESHGDLPLVVLQAAGTYADAPADMRRQLEAARAATQRRIVATSSRGQLRKVADTSHDIELDQPQAVVDAVTQVLRELGPAHG